MTAVPAVNKEAYLESARTFSKIFKELGATRVVECWGDDVPDGEVTDFRRAVKAEDGEVVVFAWVEYPSKAVRDAAMAKMHADPRMQNAEMPLTRKRMIIAASPILDE